jgi:hypothetical protein
MSGFYFAKSDGTHQALPVSGSYVSEKTRQPANLRAETDYPVTAECQTCHGRIRLFELQQMEWAHDTTAPKAAPPGG